MARWNPPRWSLGASALAGLAIAGCGAAGAPPSNSSLRTADEQRLLALVASTRSAAANHDVTAVRIQLGRFVADVNALRAAGELRAATATSLDQQALATEAQVSQQLRSATTERVGRKVTAIGSAGGRTSPGTRASADTSAGTVTTTVAPWQAPARPDQPDPPQPPLRARPQPGHGAAPDGPGAPDHGSGGPGAGAPDHGSGGPGAGAPDHGSATPPGTGPHGDPANRGGWGQEGPSAGSGNGRWNQWAGDRNGGGSD